MVICLADPETRAYIKKDLKAMIEKRLTWRKEVLLAEEIPPIPNVKRSASQLNTSLIYQNAKSQIPNRLNKILVNKVRKNNADAQESGITPPKSYGGGKEAIIDSDHDFGYYKPNLKRPKNSTLDQLTSKLMETRRLLDVLHETEALKTPPTSSGIPTRSSKRKLLFGPESPPPDHDTPTIADFVSASASGSELESELMDKPKTPFSRLESLRQSYRLKKPKPLNRSVLLRNAGIDSGGLKRSPRNLSSEKVQKVVRNTNNTNTDKQSRLRSTPSPESYTDTLVHVVQAKTSSERTYDPDQTLSILSSDPFTDSDFLNPHRDYDDDASSQRGGESDGFSLCSENISQVEARNLLNRSEKRFSEFLDSFENKDSPTKDSIDSFLENERLAQKLNELDDILSDRSSADDLRFTTTELPILLQNLSCTGSTQTDESEQPVMVPSRDDIVSSGVSKPTLKFSKPQAFIPSPDEHLRPLAVKPKPVKRANTLPERPGNPVVNYVSYEEDLCKIEDILTKYDDLKKKKPGEIGSNKDVDSISPEISEPKKLISEGVVTRKKPKLVRGKTVESSTPSHRPINHVRRDIKTGIAKGIKQTEKSAGAPTVESKNSKQIKAMVPKISSQSSRDTNDDKKDKGSNVLGIPKTWNRDTKTKAEENRKPQSGKILNAEAPARRLSGSKQSPVNTKVPASSKQQVTPQKYSNKTTSKASKSPTNVGSKKSAANSPDEQTSMKTTTVSPAKAISDNKSGFLPTKLGSANPTSAKSSNANSISKVQSKSSPNKNFGKQAVNVSSIATANEKAEKDTTAAKSQSKSVLGKNQPKTSSSTNSVNPTVQPETIKVEEEVRAAKKSLAKGGVKTPISCSVDTSSNNKKAIRNSDISGRKPTSEFQRSHSLKSRTPLSQRGSPNTEAVKKPFLRAGSSGKGKVKLKPAPVHLPVPPAREPVDNDAVDFVVHVSPRAKIDSKNVEMGQEKLNKPVKTSKIKGQNKMSSSEGGEYASTSPEPDRRASERQKLSQNSRISKIPLSRTGSIKKLKRQKGIDNEASALDLASSVDRNARQQTTADVPVKSRIPRSSSLKRPRKVIR